MNWKKAVSVVLLLGLLGCGVWERKVVFPGSSEGDALEIRQPFPANGWGIQVVLSGKDARKTLYELRGDVFLDFADVAWANDDGVVAVFTCGTPALRMAYGRGDADSTPFSQMEPAVAAHIRERYRLDPKLSDKSVLEWACSPDGKDAFLKLYPDAVAR
jgi:hypothetical protein